eukprot:TRINITY_DN1688_c0_g3_i2.p1 TRINITY_DN1688_c0_g3~~TRINITY_DN1688_c0_g3_i2.p1  ORF type:complete len:808 (+),score=89.18 TRINITY_DN1688_c0_g3_i2:520-2943(+)
MESSKAGALPGRAGSARCHGVECSVGISVRDVRRRQSPVRSESVKLQQQVRAECSLVSKGVNGTKMGGAAISLGSHTTLYPANWRNEQAHRDFPLAQQPPTGTHGGVWFENAAWPAEFAVNPNGQRDRPADLELLTEVDRHGSGRIFPSRGPSSYHGPPSLNGHGLVQEMGQSSLSMHSSRFAAQGKDGSGSGFLGAMPRDAEGSNGAGSGRQLQQGALTQFGPGQGFIKAGANEDAGICANACSAMTMFANNLLDLCVGSCNDSAKDEEQQIDSGHRILSLGSCCIPQPLRQAEQAFHEAMPAPIVAPCLPSRPLGFPEVKAAHQPFPQFRNCVHAGIKEVPQAPCFKGIPKGMVVPQLSSGRNKPRVSKLGQAQGKVPSAAKPARAERNGAFRGSGRGSKAEGMGRGGRGKGADERRPVRGGERGGGSSFGTPTERNTQLQQQLASAEPRMPSPSFDDDGDDLQVLDGAPPIFQMEHRRTSLQCFSGGLNGPSRFIRGGQSSEQAQPATLYSAPHVQSALVGGLSLLGAAGLPPLEACAPIGPWPILPALKRSFPPSCASSPLLAPTFVPHLQPQHSYSSYDFYAPQQQPMAADSRSVVLPLSAGPSQAAASPSVVQQQPWAGQLWPHFPTGVFAPRQDIDGLQGSLLFPERELELPPNPLQQLPLREEGFPQQQQDLQQMTLDDNPFDTEMMAELDRELDAVRVEAPFVEDLCLLGFAHPGENAVANGTSANGCLTTGNLGGGALADVVPPTSNQQALPSAGKHKVLCSEEIGALLGDMCSTNGLLGESDSDHGFEEELGRGRS